MEHLLSTAKLVELLMRYASLCPPYPPGWLYRVLVECREPGGRACRLCGEAVVCHRLNRIVLRAVIVVPGRVKPPTFAAEISCFNRLDKIKSTFYTFNRSAI